MNDPGHNDFKGIVDTIVDSGRSINIDGRAGTGKSFMVNSLIKEFKRQESNFKAFAPTNKACRIIHGQTRHKSEALFISNFENKYKYVCVFID